MSKSGIYQFTHRATGRIYIGSSVNLEARRKEHIRQAGKLPAYFSQSLCKYGIEEFEYTVLEYCDVSVLIEREQHYLDTLQPFKPNGFNLAQQAGSSLGVKHTDATKQRMSEARKGRKHTQSTKDKISKANKGRKLPPVSDDTREKLRSAGTGRVFSETSKKKISRALKGKAKPVQYIYEIEGRVYTTARQAADELNERINTITYRCEHTAWANWTRRKV